MPDSRSPTPPPRDWSDAFAALPLETPPADGWALLRARLPQPVAARPAHRRPTRRVAIAAAVAMAALLPAWWLHQPGPPSATPVAMDLPMQASDASVMPAHGAPAIGTAPAATTLPGQLATAAPVEESTPGTLHGAAPPAMQRRPAMASTKRVATPSSDPLDTLYAESAQLEAVLAQLPEARMANAATEALSAGLHDHVASIDVALSQPALPPDVQADLWQQRVDTLRQLTGVEATQRWQVARGDTRGRPDNAIY